VSTTTSDRLVASSWVEFFMARVILFVLASVRQAGVEAHLRESGAST